MKFIVKKCSFGPKNGLRMKSWMISASSMGEATYFSIYKYFVKDIAETLRFAIYILSVTKEHSYIGVPILLY